jgi:hypothetical protein
VGRNVASEAELLDYLQARDQSAAAVASHVLAITNGALALERYMSRLWSHSAPAPCGLFSMSLLVQNPKTAQK